MELPGVDGSGTPVSSFHAQHDLVVEVHHMMCEHRRRSQVEL